MKNYSQLFKINIFRIWNIDDPIWEKFFEYIVRNIRNSFENSCQNFSLNKTWESIFEIETFKYNSLQQYKDNL